MDMDVKWIFNQISMSYYLFTFQSILLIFRQKVILLSHSFRVWTGNMYELT